MHHNPPTNDGVPLVSKVWTAPLIHTLIHTQLTTTHSSLRRARPAGYIYPGAQLRIMEGVGVHHGRDQLHIMEGNRYLVEIWVATM